MRKSEREYVEVLKDLGGEIVSMKHGRHWRVQVKIKNGDLVYVTIPSSPGDWRSKKNFSQQFVRLMAR